ncbi:MAG: hypothetical protein ABI670_15085 [Chloroflexota bacterium]
MDPYTTNGGAQPEPQTPPYHDPNPTRYIPPQEVTRPEVPNSNPGTVAPPYQAAGQTDQQSQYAPPNPNGVPPSYQYINQNTVPYAPAPTPRTDRDRTLLAAILIGAGVLFMLGQFSFFPGFGDIVLLLIGGIFMYAYFTTKPSYRVGFLIPGAILSGIGLGVLLENLPGINFLFGGDITAITLGLGFCTIWFFERKHWWALIPGGIILLGGLSSIFRVGALWPLVLIGLGLYLLYEQTRRRR